MTNLKSGVMELQKTVNHKITKDKLTIKQLTYFEAIVDSDFNISEASRMLNTSQPGISRQIKNMEDMLGFVIFKRTKKRLNGLTEQGEIVLRNVREIKKIMHSMHIIKDLAQKSKTGSLFIATTPNVAHYVAYSMGMPFMKRYPDMDLRLHVAPIAQINQLIKESVVHLSVVSGTPDEMSALNEVDLSYCFSWNYSLIARDNHPLLLKNKSQDLLPDEISRYPFIACSSGVSGASMIENVFTLNNVNFRVALTTPDEETVRKTVLSMKNSIGVVSVLEAVQTPKSELSVLNFKYLRTFHTYYCNCARSPAMQHPGIPYFLDMLDTSQKLNSSFFPS